MPSPSDSLDASGQPASDAPAGPGAGTFGVADGGRRAATVLHRVFGYENFRGRQEEVISHVIGGGDALVLMPTGGGKSLCYQIPALVRPGTGIVISPLIALMQDQVQALRQLGIRADFLNSTQDSGYPARGRAAVQGGRTRPALPRARAAAVAGDAWTCCLHRGSRCSRSTRRTACPSGATTSGPTTSSSRCCTSAGRTCRGSRSPRRRRRRRARRSRSGSSWPARSCSCRRSTGRTSSTGSCRRTSRSKQLLSVPAHRARRRGGDRLLPVAGLDGEDRGVPDRQRDPRAALPRGA